MAPLRPRLAGARSPSTAQAAATLLVSLLAFSPASVYADPRPVLGDEVLLPPGPVLPSNPDPPAPKEHTFTLRHIYHHGTYRHPELHRKRDVIHEESKVFLAAEDGHDEREVRGLKAKSRSTSIERLVDRRPSVVDPMVAESRKNGYAAVLDMSAWTVDDVSAPDVTEKETILSMAIISANAYVANETDADWQEVGKNFDRGVDFGWETDGLRGHVFADENNSTIIIGLKGTSMAIFDGEGTSTKDKENDNLFFSCCCGQQGQWTYRQVCDCATGTYTCNNTCVTQALREEHRYYTAARELYSNVTELYPDSAVWLAGHSLGGAVASLLGLTYGLPAITFEAVPEAMAASRLGLPVPPGADPNYPQMREKTGSFHVGHTADPVYIGTCSGASGSCSYAGYALESQCHSGYECVYDVVADKGWRVGIGTHKIRSVIDQVITQYDEVPECRLTPECRDCGQWKMYESNGTETTTTPPSQPSPTHTRTRTSTCKTPGWWGCLDTTTSAPEVTTTTTSSSSTSTCKTPGWFGCNDKTTTTTTTSSSTTTTTTTTCHTPGRFWGCRDEITPSPEPNPGAAVPTVTALPTATATDASDAVDPGEERCVRRNWFGFCTEWEGDRLGFVSDEM